MSINRIQLQSLFSLILTLAYNITRSRFHRVGCPRILINMNSIFELLHRISGLLGVNLEHTCRMICIAWDPSRRLMKGPSLATFPTCICFDLGWYLWTHAHLFRQLISTPRWNLRPSIARSLEKRTMLHSAMHFAIFCDLESDFYHEALRCFHSHLYRK